MTDRLLSQENGQRAARLTHGRHCPCSACARENWANPRLAPCGMHGSSCAPVYAPIYAPLGSRVGGDPSVGRIYTWSYTEAGTVPVTEQDAREHMDQSDTELTEEHWRAAARYLAPEHLESCLDLDDWEAPRR